MTGPNLKRGAAGAVILLAVAASAYTWWWKPVVLTSLRFAMEGALAKSSPAVTFGALDLDGISTVVVRGLSAGRLDQDFSATVREARFTFSLWRLLVTRLDPVASLKTVALVEPLVTVTRAPAPPDRPGKAPAFRLPASLPPLPAHAQLKVTDGRILLRVKGSKAPPDSVSDIDAWVLLPAPGAVDVEVRLTAPESPRQGVALRAIMSGGSMTVTANLRKLRFAPLVGWARKLDPPILPELGALSGSLKASLTRTGAGGWSLDSLDGRADVAGAAFSVRGVPVRFREANGTARFDGTQIRVTELALLANDVPWRAAGTVTGLGRPELHLTAETSAFDAGKYEKGARGTGSVILSADGPADDPILTVEPALKGLETSVLSCERLEGKIAVSSRGTAVDLIPARIAFSGAEISLAGRVEPGAGPAASLSFTATPEGGILPAWSGTARLSRATLSLTAASADGVWRADLKAVRGGDSWSGNLAAKSSSGARLSASGKAGIRAPHRLSGTVALKAAGMADLYLARALEALKRIEGTIDASGSLSGSADGPVLALSLAGGGLSVHGRPLGLAGSLRADSGGIRLDPLTLGDHTNATIRIPSGTGPSTVSAAFQGAPLALLLAAADSPGTARRTEGAVYGRVSLEAPGGPPSVKFNLEARETRWDGAKMGTLSAIGEGREGNIKATRLKISGPSLSVDGSGTVSSPAGWDWSAAADLTVNYLKYGKADLDCRAKVAAGSRAGDVSADLELTSVRVGAAAYSDATVGLKYGRDGTAGLKLSWEDLAWVSATLKPDAEKTLAFTSSFTDFPVSVLADAMEVPAPAQRLSGSLSLKGPRARTGANASLKWERGEADIKGWLNLGDPRRFALTVTALDTGFAGWLPLLRAATPFAKFPECDARVEARGVQVERNGDAPAVSGWVGARNLSVSGVACGDGSLRVTTDGGTSEVEGSLEGPQGKYTLYPTRLKAEGARRTLAGALGFSGLPAGKSTLSCARAAFEAAWEGAAATVDLALASLGLGNQALERVSARAERRGGKWRLSSPPESPWQVIGTVSVEGNTLATENDERVGAPAILVRGAGGVAVKAGGTWTIPAIPGRFSLEVHNLPAAPLFEALGAPPARGLTEADLDWDAKMDPPMSGKIAVIGTCWGELTCDRMDARISGTPGKSFALTALHIVRGEDFSARGSGTLTLHPVQSMRLSLSVERLQLRYLKPLGFLDDSDVVASGALAVSGEPGNLGMEGTLKCTPGTVAPRTAFSSLYLTEGRMDFTGNRTTLTAALNDISGAPVQVSGAMESKDLVPYSFTLLVEAPKPVKIDAIPDIFRGTARGKVRFEGTPDSPAFRGEVTLEEGRLKTPPAGKKGGGKDLGDRLFWDIAVKFGSGVQYVLGGTEGNAIELALLSPLSHVSVKGKGDDFKVTGEVIAEKGPLTLFLGKQLWKK